jgi:hypothetical protein
VRFITTIRQRWKKALSASLTIALLSAVLVVGATLFSSEVFAAWKTPGNASGGILDGVLDFEAPAATVAAFQAKSEEGQLVKNWKNTDSPLLDSILSRNTQLSYQLVTNANTPQTIIPGLSLSYNQIASNPALSPFAAQIALSAAMSFQGTIISQIILPVLNTLAPTNPLAKTLSQVFTIYVNTLIATQASILATIPPTFRPPPIPPASPST